MFFSEYHEIFKNIFLYRTPLVAASEFLTKLAKNNCKENHLSVEIFSDFLSLSCNILKITHLQVFHSFCLSLNMSEGYLEPIQTSRWSLCKDS